MAEAPEVWTRSKIIRKLRENDRAVEIALQRIFNRQTAMEQRSEQTVSENNRGFTAADAKTLTNIAKKQVQWNGKLTPRQIALVRLRICKYWRQLLEEAQARGQAVSFNPDR